MSKELLANGRAYIRENISADATTIKLNRSGGFPVLPSNGNWFWVEISDDNYVEIVKVTAFPNDVMTVVRAQQGTIARAFHAGSRVQSILTQKSMDGLQRNPDGDPAVTIYVGCSEDVNAGAGVLTKNGNRTVIWARGNYVQNRSAFIVEEDNKDKRFTTMYENELQGDVRSTTGGFSGFAEGVYNRVFLKATHLQPYDCVQISTNEFFNVAGVKHNNISVVTANCAWWGSVAGAGATRVKIFDAWLGGTNGNVTIDVVYAMYLNVMKQTGVTKGYGIYQAGASDINMLKGRTYIGAPATAADDTELVAGQLSFYLDESAHNLLVRVKYSNGTTLKLGTVALV